MVRNDDRLYNAVDHDVERRTRRSSRDVPNRPPATGAVAARRSSRRSRPCSPNWKCPCTHRRRPRRALQSRPEIECGRSRLCRRRHARDIGHERQHHDARKHDRRGVLIILIAHKPLRVGCHAPCRRVSTRRSVRIAVARPPAPERTHRVRCRDTRCGHSPRRRDCALASA